MFRDLLSSRLIQAGIVFFLLCVGGSVLYSWYTTRVEWKPEPFDVESFETSTETLLRTAKTEGDTAKVRQLSTEIARLKEEAQGEIPTGATVVTFGFPGESMESAKQRGIQKANEDLERARKELNLQQTNF